jgi:hypothetical protein
VEVIQNSPGMTEGNHGSRQAFRISSVVAGLFRGNFQRGNFKMKPTRLSSSATKQAMNRQCLFSLVHGRGILSSDCVFWGYNGSPLLAWGKAHLGEGSSAFLPCTPPSYEAYESNNKRAETRWDPVISKEYPRNYAAITAHGRCVGKFGIDFEVFGTGGRAGT